MKKETKLFALIFIGLFVISIFAASFASAQEPIKDFFIKLFGTARTGSGTLELAGIKFLVFLLLTFVIYSIVSIIPVLGEKETLAWPIALIVAFLSTFYIAPGEIFGILQTYTALGLTLTAIIPFMIILAFAWKIAEKPTPANLLIQKLTLVFFAAFLVYRGAILFFYPPAGIAEQTLGYARIVYGIVLAATLVTLIWQKQLLAMILKSKIEGWIETGKAGSKQEAAAKALMLRELAQYMAKQGNNDGAVNAMHAAEALEKQATSMS